MNRFNKSSGGVSKQRGFTLTEALVATAVASVMAAVGLPNLQGAVRYQAVYSHVESLRSDVRLARHESARRGEVVTLCARDPLAGEQALQCGGQRTLWSNGWLVFIDRGQRGVVDAGDRILRVHQPVGAQGAIQTTAAYLSFQPSGISLNAASHFRFFAQGEDLNDPQARDVLLVCINKIGRARVTTDATCSG